MSSFDQAVSKINNSKHLKLNNDVLLKLYSYYKQAIVGPCTVPKPSFFNVKEQAKWEAWKNLGDMSKEYAKKEYITLVDRLLN